MLLALDIGNSNTVAGVFDNGRLLKHFRLTSDLRMTTDECGFFVLGLLDKLAIKPDKINRVVIASVVPRLTPVYRKMVTNYLACEAIIVSADLKLPIKIGYDNPAAVGADRIANAVAGYSRFGGPIIIVDYGTTTNFDVIDAGGTYLGGAIAPGPETSARELARRAAKLFEVSIEKPQNAIGRNTADSIKSGLFYGTIGQVDMIIELISRELGEKPKIIATGGLAADFVEHSRFIESSHPELTLEGLKIIADYQR